MPLTFISPVFCKFLRGFVQPVLVSGEPDYFDGGKPFWRIWCRVAQWRQLAHAHQNLNVILREAEQLCRRRDIKPGRQIPRRPGRQRRLR